MAVDLKKCNPSPRIEEDGTLYIYEGDTACIDIEIELYRICEEKAVEIIVPFQQNDKVRICFKENLTKRKVYEFEFSNIQNNTVTLCISKEITKLFKKGVYTYCVHIDTFYEDEGTKTISYENRMVVE